MYVLAIRCFIHPFIYDSKTAADKQPSRSRGWSCRGSASAALKRLEADGLAAHLKAVEAQIERLGSSVCGGRINAVPSCAADAAAGNSLKNNEASARLLPCARTKSAVLPLDPHTLSVNCEAAPFAG